MADEISDLERLAKHECCKAGGCCKKNINKFALGLVHHWANDIINKQLAKLGFEDKYESVQSIIGDSYGVGPNVVILKESATQSPPEAERVGYYAVELGALRKHLQGDFIGPRWILYKENES